MGTDDAHFGGGIAVYNQGGVISIEENREMLSTGYILKQNYPNPFNPTTSISYQLPVPSSVELSIYNLLGQQVATLVYGKQLAGRYIIEWDASNYSSGIYFYQLETDDFLSTKKCILLK